MKRILERWKQKTAALRIDALTLYYAHRDPRTPRIARFVAIAVAAYAFSPIDLIPDFIPVLGHLDDMVLVPLGIMLAVRLIPENVLLESRMKAMETLSDRPRLLGAAPVIIALWIALVTAASYVLYTQVIAAEIPG
ncbi:MAG: DUF1232 domain-containing protein [Spirochaetales bacterium]|nr:MAG: DUF1232 domain-containing protein [Spirochaetales bacterium]RPI96522.1 MAG: DUF1232 domain-containing protein [Spirochaetales bacterium]